MLCVTHHIVYDLSENLGLNKPSLTFDLSSDSIYGFLRKFLSNRQKIVKMASEQLVVAEMLFSSSAIR